MLNKIWVALALASAAILPAEAANNNGFETVRIATSANPRCVNSKTDEITLSVLRVTVEKTNGFFTSDNQAGIAVITTLNADGATVPAKTPSVNVLQIANQNNGQVFLPLEYPIASRLALTQPASANGISAETKNMLLEMYLEKTRGSNTFGSVLTAAGNLLGKLPIPPNPYLTAANQFLSFANQTIQSETKDAGAKLFATVSFQFADRDYSDVKSCKNAGDEETGAVAVIAATGHSDSNLLKLGNLSQQYCWRYSLDSTFEIQYASKPVAGCSGIADAAWAEPSNDYVMLLLSAATIPPSRPLNAELSFTPLEPAEDLKITSRRLDDLENAVKLCDSVKAPHALCGVK